MFASIRTYRVDEDRIPELLRRVDEEFVPRIASEPGFVSYQAIRGNENLVVTITIFHDVEGARRSVQVAAEFVRARLDDIRVERIDVKGGEVLLNRAGEEILTQSHV